LSELLSDLSELISDRTVIDRAAYASDNPADDGRIGTEFQPNLSSHRFVQPLSQQVTLLIGDRPRSRHLCRDYAGARIELALETPEQDLQAVKTIIFEKQSQKVAGRLALDEILEQFAKNLSLFFDRDDGTLKQLQKLIVRIEHFNEAIQLAINLARLTAFDYHVGQRSRVPVCYGV
jgi:hypothetical protein